MLFVLGLVAVVFVATPPAYAKSFRVAAVQIEAELRADASMRVVEHITYDFDGSFSEGLRPVPPGPYQIVDVSVSENGQQLPVAGVPHDLSWRFAAEDERRTFSIAYTVLGAAQVGPDVAELYWKWVGEQHPGVGAVRVLLSVPGEGGVRAWAHGPFDGGVEIRANQVLFSVDGLPGGQFVEGRVAVPAANFSVAPSGPPRLDAIVAEESALADAANTAREREEQLRRAFRWLLPIVPVIGWLVFLAAWLRWGREHNPSVDVGEYVREPPPDPPAFVDTLFRFGSVRPIALSATVVDLAQRGHLVIEETVEDRAILPDKRDWIFRRTVPPTGDAMLAYEATVLERLFALGPETSQSAFVKWVENNRTTAERWWERFKDEVAQTFKARHYVEGGKGAAFGINILAGSAVALAGAGALIAGEPIGLALVGSSVLQFVFTPTLRRRTPAGAQRTAEWEAFERFLRHFSQLEDAPVGHLALWERYMVYAVALGVADEVAEGLQARIPAEAEAVAGGTRTTTFAPWYRGAGGFGSFGSLGNFAGDFGPTIVAAAQPPSDSSSGSGFGGGFSGGGGGGGGGGGIGAR